MPKINFADNPARMDFSIVKLSSGANLVDNTTGDIHSLGDGDLPAVVSGAGNSLRATIEKTLTSMKNGQVIRVQIIVVAAQAIEYGRGYGHDASFGHQLGFMFAPSESAPVHIIQPKDKIKPGSGNAVPDQKLVVIPVATDGFTAGREMEIKHPQTDNRANDGSIVELT